MNELKPCPFCGGVANIYGGSYSQESYMISCLKCHCKIEHTDKQILIDKWNTRTQSQCELVKMKFKDVPIGGRIFEYGKVWTVIENYGYGLLHEYTGVKNPCLSVVSFIDEGEGITLDTEVNFIVEKLPTKEPTK